MPFKDRATIFFKTIMYGFGTKDANGKRFFSMLQLALFIFVSATIVFLATASISYNITRQKAMKDANAIMEQNMALATEIINRHLLSVEHSGYSLATIFLSKEVAFDENGDPYNKFVFHGENGRLTVGQMYDLLEKFVRANPHLWGAALGFEPFVYPEYGDAGVAPFVRHTKTTLYEHLSLPEMRNNYRDDDWYNTTKETGKPRWCRPFVDVKGEIISCFCIPIYYEDGRFIGALAVDMMLRGFAEDLKREIHPYEGSEIMVIGPGNKFLVHPDPSSVMTSSIESIEQYKKEKAKQGISLFYRNMDSDQMILAVSCPDKAIYAELDELLDNLIKYAGWGLLFVEIICLLTFILLKRLVESKASIEGELIVASNIQRSMLPMMFPAFPDRNDVDLCAMLRPAKSVGGDLYDYLISKNDSGHDTLVFAVGDVSGKGVPAAMLMAVVCSLFRNMAIKTTDPRAIACDINNCISQRNEYDMFCTMFIGSLDLVTGLLTFCNAGHNPPVIISDGKARYLDTIANIPLGALDEFEYKSETLQMEREDIIFIYTDGVTEAENFVHNGYSDERLLTLLNSVTKQKTSDVIERVAQSISAFVGKTEQSDDTTMLAIKINKA